MKNLKYILIVVFVIIILIVIFSFTSPTETKEETIKKNEINNMFAIWMNVAGAGDKQTLAQNEIPIKKDLYEKLNAQEILSLKGYSMALQNLMSVKSRPFDPLFLSSLAYLTTNFKTAKETIGKTSAKNVFANFGFGGVGTMPGKGIESSYKSSISPPSVSAPTIIQSFIAQSEMMTIAFGSGPIYNTPSGPVSYPIPLNAGVYVKIGDKIMGSLEEITYHDGKATSPIVTNYFIKIKTINGAVPPMLTWFSAQYYPAKYASQSVKTKNININ
jgi:hypothetical protein